MDIEEIIKDSKSLRSRIFNFMLVVLVAGCLLAYFKTSTTEIVFSCACAAISIFLYKKHSDITGFIEFLEKDEKKN